MFFHMRNLYDMRFSILLFFSNRYFHHHSHKVTIKSVKSRSQDSVIPQICRRLVRSTGLVRTGMGAAREDVNVSVTGGTRIEIKGVPKITKIPLLTYNEAMRQWNLLRLKDELESRGITSETFEATTHDVTRLAKKTHFQPLLLAANSNLIVEYVILKGFEEILNWRTQTDTFFSREISDRVRVIACLTTIPNIVHYDSKGDNLSSAEWQKIKKITGAGEGNDTVVLVWGDERDADTASTCN